MFMGTIGLGNVVMRSEETDHCREVLYDSKLLMYCPFENWEKFQLRIIISYTRDGKI